MIFNHKSLSRILFLDIETVSVSATYEELPGNLKKHWKHKCAKSKWAVDPLISSENAISLHFTNKAGIFSEFAKVVCISVGLLKSKKDKMSIRIKSFYGHDEHKILSDFKVLMDKHFHNIKKQYICGHNLKEFDIPFLCRRMLINNIALPKMLAISGLKPWQTTHLLDTLEMWKFGDYKNYTSLDLLTAVFDIESPKDDMDGSLVSHAYYVEDNLPKIIAYCERDVVSVAQLLLRFNQLPLITTEDISSRTSVSFEDEEE